MFAAEPVATPDPARAAQARLDQSIEALRQLRAQIAAEELPMTQELNRLEDQVTQMRRQNESMARAADAGNLETANLKAQVKIRQDELTYVGNLLDEYARSFESKVHVSELQPGAATLEAAKQAPENTTLSATEKFAHQLAFVGYSLRRLSDLVGGLRFSGVGVDLQGGVTEGQFAIIGPVALFRSVDGKTAGLAVPQTGSPKPLIRPLEAGLNLSLAALVETGQGLLPLDPSRGGALKELIQKTSLIEIFRKGGPIMWPLLCASVLALGTVFERIIFLLLERGRRRPQELEDFLEATAHGDFDRAVSIGQASRFYVVRALGYALEHREKSLANALLFVQARELKRFRRGIPVLDTIITLAPLLGLLGTVTGMMSSFSLIGGELSAPGAITGGIAEALIATAFGLGIAITSLIPFNILNSVHEEARHELEAASTQVELMLRSYVPVVPATADHSRPAAAAHRAPESPRPGPVVVSTGAQP